MTIIESNGISNSQYILSNSDIHDEVAKAIVKLFHTDKPFYSIQYLKYRSVLKYCRNTLKAEDRI